MASTEYILWNLSNLGHISLSFDEFPKSLFGNRGTWKSKLDAREVIEEIAEFIIGKGTARDDSDLRFSVVRQTGK